MGDSSAIEKLRTALAAGGPLCTNRLADECGMSRRWVQQKMKALREETDNRASGPETAPPHHDTGLLRFQERYGKDGEVTRYAPMSTDPDGFHGIVDSRTGDHHDA